MKRKCSISKKSFRKPYYPVKYKYFEGKDEEIEYCNNIRYTDYVIEKIMQELDSISTPLWVLYVSDHGESPGYGIRRFARYSTWEIPFAFWFNKSFRQQHKKLVDAVEKNVWQPFQSDCVFEIIVSLMGGNWNKLRKERIPFSPEFVPPKRVLRKIKDRHPQRNNHDLKSVTFDKGNK